MTGSLNFFSLIGLFSLWSFLANGQMISCSLKGKVVGRESKNILLHRATDDARIKSIIIPVIGDSFEYQLTVPASEAYHLVFEDEKQRGFWRPIVFFPENGVVNFTLYSIDEFDKNIIEGGKLNQVLKDFNLAFSKEFESKLISLYKSLNEIKANGEGEGPKAVVLRKELEATNKKSEKWRAKYIENNPSLVSFSFFIEDLQRMEYYNDIIKHRFSLFSNNFPDHPYTKLAANKIQSLESIRVGGKYIDFSAPDLEGNVVKLSEVIKDKVVLIDFWASWCGPCIKTSRTIIPIYEEFKGKGFNVIGIARETKNSEAMKRILKREKYPWLNLIELNDKNEIWHKYNLSFSGGGTVLVNNDKEIMAINPSSEELRNILQKELSK